jgi:hypothetical protein
MFFICLSFAPFLHTNLGNFQHRIYEDITRLPPDSLIAGHPYDVDPITVFTKRRVLVQFEVSTAWYKNYYSRVKERTYDFFNAYYSDSYADVMNFCRKYKITHILVNKEHFTDRYIDSGCYYLEPYNSHIMEIIGKNKGNFILVQERMDKYKVTNDVDGFFIIKAEY